MDELVTIGNSRIQHGKHNNRIYLMKLDRADMPGIINELDQLAKKHRYSKIFVKIPSSFFRNFTVGGYVQEALIPDFFINGDDAVFASKYHSRRRKREKDRVAINDIVKLTSHRKKKGGSTSDLPQPRLCTESDIDQMQKLYSRVFESYPFPINEQDYLKEIMNSHVEFFGVWIEKLLVGLASAEMDESTMTVEMTDFATHPDFRARGMAKALLQSMEARVREKGYRLSYTISRAMSPGMNMVFSNGGYSYCGTLVNNTQICGGLESMNVWYKRLDD